MCEMAYFSGASRNRIETSTKRETTCSCEESTCDFTERILSQKSKLEIEKCKIGDLSPMISIQKLKLSHRHVEKRYDYADILLGGFADTSTKLEFSIFR